MESLPGVVPEKEKINIDFTGVLTNFVKDKLYNVPVLGMEIFIMENTTKAGAFNLTKTKIVHAAILILFTFVISHGPLMDGCFPAAVAFVAYMTYRNVTNMYLAIPAAAGIIPYIAKGYDPWGDLAAVAVSVVLFAAARKIKLETWQAAVISAAIGIICTSVGRLATSTVYRISPEKLILYGFLILAMVFIFDAAYSLREEREKGRCIFQGS